MSIIMYRKKTDRGNPALVRHWNRNCYSDWIFQVFGLDYFKTSLGKHLMTDTSWWNQLDKISFNFADKTAYTTLYNPNFLSFYFGMLIPLLVCLFIGAKKMWHRLVIAVAEIFAL